MRLLHQRRTVMKQMVAFLRNEDGYAADPKVMLDSAAALDVDRDFIAKVRPFAMCRTHCVPLIYNI